MAIITLTTDLGTKDSYLASVKGSIYSQLDDAKIIDITNDITAFNIPQAAFVLRNCYKDFPVGSIHIISVDDELSIESRKDNSIKYCSRIKLPNICYKKYFCFCCLPFS